MRALPPILCYHKVERRRELGVTRVSPRRFARQIERLARGGWRTLTLAELLDCVAGRRAVGERELVVSFDDAYRGLREHAFPVLAAHGFGAVCAVITEYAGRLNRWDVAYGGRRFAHLAWRDLRTWMGRGIDVVSHTATHPRLTWLPESDVARELAWSRDVLQAELGTASPVLVYPFGAAGGRERRLAAAEGYEAGFSLAGAWRGDVYSIPRHPVYAWAPPTPGVGPLAPLEQFVAGLTNQCAVGTTVWQRATGLATRPSASPEPAIGD